MRHGEMSSRSAKEKQTSGRKWYGENEPFLVEEIPASPVMRGKRQNSVDERFVSVGNISPSPPAVRTGRRDKSEEGEFFIREIPGSPVRTRAGGGEGIRGSKVKATTRTISEQRDCNVIASGSVIVSDPARNTMKTTSRIIADGVDDNRGDEPPNNGDGPPSYELSVPRNEIGWSIGSSLPRNQIGWSLNATSQIPSSNRIGHDDEKLTFAYPPTDLTSSSPIQLSLQAKTYVSTELPDSGSLLPLPSQSPSPDRLRPPYTYQQRAVQIVRTPMRPRFRRDYENDQDSYVKPHNEFSHKYGGIVIAIFFVTFMMVLSLAVKFLIRNSFNQ